MVRTFQVSLAGDAIPEPSTEHGSEPGRKADQSPCVSRIVSGSYDGNIAIWTRGPDRQWVVAHRLNFKDALHITSTHASGEAAVYSTVDAGRIFKVRFDERRLFCCGQGGRIVGWDFGLLQEPHM